MKANYHTHTWRCNHATGTEEAYVQTAIENGFEILGFSDHTPYLFPDGYRSRIRMLPEQLADYTGCLTDLSRQYQDRIQLHIGLEAEYYPAYFRDLLALLKDFPVEYLILGQHYVECEPYGRYSGSPTTDTDFLKQYCRQSMNALQTGKFSYFAHPDLINYVGSPAVYKEHMSEVIREIKGCGLCAEINLLGYREGRHYPGRQFLEILAEENCPVVLGCDAHSPEGLADKEAETAAKKWISEFGLTLWETVPLHSL